MRRLPAPQPPTRLARTLFRLPILLYRVRLGWLLGDRFVHIAHVGRRSGRKRHVVIEVVAKDRATGSLTVASGFGARADWYRNLTAHPEATVHLGRRRWRAVAMPLSAAEGGEVMASYAGRYGFLARRLCRFMGFEVDGSVDDYRAVGECIPFLRLDRISDSDV